jgi:hypothetical protein
MIYSLQKFRSSYTIFCVFSIGFMLNKNRTTPYLALSRTSLIALTSTLFPVRAIRALTILLLFF